MLTYAVQTHEAGAHAVKAAHALMVALLQVALLVQKYLLTSTKVQILTRLCYPSVLSPRVWW